MMGATQAVVGSNRTRCGCRVACSAVVGSPSAVVGRLQAAQLNGCGCLPAQRRPAVLLEEPPLLEPPLLELFLAEGAGPLAWKSRVSCGTRSAQHFCRQQGNRRHGTGTSWRGRTPDVSPLRPATGKKLLLNIGPHRSPHQGLGGGGVDDGQGHAHGDANLVGRLGEALEPAAGAGREGSEEVLELGAGWSRRPPGCCSCKGRRVLLPIFCSTGMHPGCRLFKLQRPPGNSVNVFRVAGVHNIDGGACEAKGWWQVAGGKWVRLGWGRGGQARCAGVRHMREGARLPLSVLSSLLFPSLLQPAHAPYASEAASLLAQSAVNRAYTATWAWLPPAWTAVRIWSPADSGSEQMREVSFCTSAAGGCV